VQIENNMVAGTRNAIIKRVPASFVVKPMMWIFDHEM
jgi:hypothetical protein